jgi:hypothetical protein
VVPFIIEQLQPADMRHMRLACTSVRQAVDQAVESLEVWEGNLVHLSQSRFSLLYFLLLAPWRGLTLRQCRPVWQSV